MPREAESIGLLALMILQNSRRNARVRNGELMTLEEQDRSLWDQGAISEGLVLVEEALGIGPAGAYQLQAAIAALHAQAGTASETDWPQIAALYETLLDRHRSPVIALNHAVAIAMSGRMNEGLIRIEELGRSGTLNGYYLLHAARGDLLRRLNRKTEASAAYQEAVALATNPVELDYLKRRLRELQ
jgi:RNA polymerase sigma-70 factor (ECF subfamily)